MDIRKLKSTIIYAICDGIVTPCRFINYDLKNKIYYLYSLTREKEIQAKTIFFNLQDALYHIHIREDVKNYKEEMPDLTSLLTFPLNNDLNLDSDYEARLAYLEKIKEILGVDVFKNVLSQLI